MEGLSLLFVMHMSVHTS